MRGAAGGINFRLEEELEKEATDWGSAEVSAKV
jgi:hypothetical protein